MKLRGFTKPTTVFERMLIRPLEPHDYSDWLRLRRALWPDCSEAMHACEMAAYAASSSTRAVFVLARENGRLGGFVEVSERDRVDGSMSPRVAYLEGWFVEPDLRGHGFGRSLVATAERWGLARGLTELASDAGLDNTQACGAHQALGFRETFRLVHFLKSLHALVALLTLLGLTNSANAASVCELKILSFNIWVNGGCSLNNCIEVIRTAGADIVTHPNKRKFPDPFASNEPDITWTPLTNEEPKGVFDRIDFVYFSPGDGALVTSSTELEGRNSVNPWPSDHRAVLSTFTHL